MPRDATPGLADKKASDVIAVAFEGAHHRKNGIARRRQYSSHDHVSDFALRMAADDGDLARRPHASSFNAATSMMRLS